MTNPLPIIEVHNLGKKYNLSLEKRSSLREAVANKLTIPTWRRFGPAEKPLPVFWALRGVTFKIYSGEALGIIGENGAGKSTLLKILSRITEPTEGRVIVRGKVTSLLEIGTGFNAELTGRENVYLNGAILGIGFRGVRDKFAQIVKFADIGKFIDVPMKKYSSGMYIRLAFSVAVHLEPEIVLLDEVFAVGDIAFQKKSLAKITQIIKEKRTVIFVSHNLSAVENFCTRAIWLEKGRLVMDQSVNKTTKAYFEEKIVKPDEESKPVPLALRADRIGNQAAKLTDLAVTNNRDGRPTVRCTDELKIALALTRKDPTAKTAVVLSIIDEYGVPVFWLDSRYSLTTIPKDSQKLFCQTGPINIIPGRYNINAAILVNDQVADQVAAAASFMVEKTAFFGSQPLPEHQHGLVLVKQQWQN